MRAGFTALQCLCLSASACFAGGLQIEVLRGNGLNNRHGQLASAIMLRVSDETGRRVVGAAIIFSSANEGPSVDFGGTGNGAQARTDAAGMAVGPSMRPTGGNGPVEIFVLAEKDGVFGNARIHQMNLGFAPPTAADDLDLTKLPSAAGAGRGQRLLRLSVTNGAGAPVASAKVSLLLPMKTGFNEMAVKSRPDGIAEFSFDPKNVRGQESVLVRAEANRLTASRFISIE